jgi:hypothetical protein|tara:strand:+ start:3549 stop:3824 length:276 start_codon:yes stop_codon:yes gene_type:complete
MKEKINFDNELEYNADELLKQQKKEHEEMLDTFNNVLMPKIEKIIEWHQSSEDKHLIPDVYRELLIGWYFTNKGLATNWIDKEFNSSKNIY